MAVFRHGNVNHMDPPPHIADYLREKGGINPYGEPMIRISWSNSLTKDARIGFPSLPVRVIENPRRRKYGKVFVNDRFVIEIWQPAETYGEPEDWVESEYSRTGALIDYGPYPSRGAYLMLDVVEDSLGRYLEPTRAYCDTVMLASNIKKSRTPKDDIRVMDEIAARDERERDSRRLDAIKDANKPSNYYDSWVSLNIPGKKESIQ